MKYNTGTIRQTLARLHDEGMNITENTLRTWVRNGLVPATYCGRKAYIYYPNVIKLLQDGMPTLVSEPALVAGIRKIG